MLKAYKYRLYPTEGQKAQFEQHFDACRLIWNLALEVKRTAWQTARKNISVYELKRQLPELKKENEWLYKVNSQSLAEVLFNLDDAFKWFFKGKGYPRFKRKNDLQRFHCPQFVRIEKNYLILPKIKGVKFIKSKTFEGKIKTVTISKTPSGKYFTSVLVDNAKEIPFKPLIKEETTVGIDVGLKSFVITSNGVFFEPNKKLKENLKRLKSLQSRASRKKKGGKNREKANLFVARLHEKIANQRTDYIHKITTQLIRDKQAETFVTEDLNVSGLLKNRKLSQAIHDASFGDFFRQLKYKCEWYGKNLIVIDRFAPSSKRCSDCGEINNTLTLDHRMWTCACGANHDRDINAAKNIKYFGLEKHSGVGSPGEPVEPRRIRRVKKQEVNLDIPMAAFKDQGLI